MKKILALLIGCFSVVILFAQETRVVVDFNKDWRFQLGDDSAAIHSRLQTASWRLLNLPHDWSIEGTFSDTLPATIQGGALPMGIGWYQKQFMLPATWKRKEVSIHFDGVYRNGEVWVNGQYVGKRPNGYISFQYDITKFLKAAPESNTVAVRVDNSLQPNSRWYTGSGIYRNVYLEATEKVHIQKEQFFVFTPKVEKDRAVIYSKMSLSRKGLKTLLKQVLKDAKGKVVGTATQTTGGADFVQLDMVVGNPNLWSPQQPYLYQLETELWEGGKLRDRFLTKIGIRKYRFEVETGFYMNDIPLKIQGVCLHHDAGALGAVVSVPAIERQLRILKNMGCNAIRTAHNPPSPEFLDACDRMGFLVMVEAFDMWKKKKNKFDYAMDYKGWHVKDLEDMVLRDRNHPSVFMWSIGNEIREQFDSTGISMTQELVHIIKSLDTTRPVTAGLSESDSKKNFLYQSGALDIVGLNYHHETYASFREQYPGQKFLGAENMSAFATRGVYDQKSDSTYFWPAHSPLKFVEKGRPDWTVSAYDQVSAYWGTTHEGTWKIIKKFPFLSGLFVWSGFDFLGEPIPYPWPARSSYYGIVDLAGFPKDVYYMYQSEWTQKPVLHVFPHWNWKEGQEVDVWAYYNHADEVELFLNGKSLGKRTKAGDALHVLWRVPFEPGTLKAVSYQSGKPIKVQEIRTAGAPAGLVAKVDKKILKTGKKDLAFVEVMVVDAAGNLVPDADPTLEFKVTGKGSLAATDNGYQADTSSFATSFRKAWKGKALGIIRSGSKKGNITLEIKSAGLKSTFVHFKSED